MRVLMNTYIHRYIYVYIFYKRISIKKFINVRSKYFWFGHMVSAKLTKIRKITVVYLTSEISEHKKNSYTKKLL